MNVHLCSLGRNKFNKRGIGNNYSAACYLSDNLDPGFLEAFGLVMAPRTSLERLPSIRDSFAVRQVIREWLVSPSVVPSHVRAVAKNDKLSLRQFVLEKNVPPVRLPKQDWRHLYLLFLLTTTIDNTDIWWLSSQSLPIKSGLDCRIIFGLLTVWPRFSMEIKLARGGTTR